MFDTVQEDEDEEEKEEEEGGKGPYGCGAKFVSICEAFQMTVWWWWWWW